MEKKKVFVPVSVEDELPTNDQIVIDCGDGYFDCLYRLGSQEFVTFYRGKWRSHSPTHWLKEQELYCFTADELKRLISDTYCEGYIDSTGHSESGESVSVKKCISDYIKSLNIK